MNVVADMLLTEPTPLVIWGSLLVLTVPAVLLLGCPDILREPGRALRQLFAALHRGKPVRPSPQDAAEIVRFADEVQVAADRAAVAAGRWRQRWEDANEQQAVDWQAWIDADSRLRDSVAAAAFGTSWSAPSCAEYAERERFLHRAVATAVERGDLPAAATADALAGRNGWDARLHPLEQQLVINRAAAAYRRRRYDLTAQAERDAWNDAGSADRAAHALRRTAQEAALRAAGLRTALPTGAARRRVNARLVPVPAV